MMEPSVKNQDVFDDRQRTVWGTREKNTFLKNSDKLEENTFLYLCLQNKQDRRKLTSKMVCKEEEKKLKFESVFDVKA